MIPGGLFSELHDCVCGFQGKDVFFSVGSKGYKPEAATCALQPLRPCTNTCNLESSGNTGLEAPRVELVNH